MFISRSHQKILVNAAIEREIKINLVFLEKGHTQNVNDTVHSVIEGAKNGVNIHHPHQWVTLIETACRKNPYKVYLMSQEEIFNFKTNLAGVFDLLIKNKILDKSGKKTLKVSWLKIKQIQFKPSFDDNIYMEFKYDLTAADFMTIIIGRMPRRLRCHETNPLNVPRLYANKLPIKPSLRKVILQNFLFCLFTLVYLKLYINIFQQTTGSQIP